MNGSEDNSSRLKRLFRGLHSVFWHTAGSSSWTCVLLLQTLTYTHTVKRAHRVPLIQHGDPFVICSSPALFAWIFWKLPFCRCRFGDTLKWRRVNKTPKTHILTRRTTTTKKGFWTIKWTNGANSKKKIKKKNKKKSITVCFKTVNSWKCVQVGSDEEPDQTLCGG